MSVGGAGGTWQEEEIFPGSRVLPFASLPSIALLPEAHAWAYPLMFCPNCVSRACDAYEFTASGLPLLPPC